MFQDPKAGHGRKRRERKKKDGNEDIETILHKTNVSCCVNYSSLLQSSKIIYKFVILTCHIKQT